MLYPSSVMNTELHPMACKVGVGMAQHENDRVNYQTTDQIRQLAPSVHYVQVVQQQHHQNHPIVHNGYLSLSQVKLAVKQRRGRWLRQEEEYAQVLIGGFESGLCLDCENGLTLRAYLSKKLLCSPMRISKKFAGKKVGTLVFVRKPRNTDDPNLRTQFLMFKEKSTMLEQMFFHAVLEEDDRLQKKNQDSSKQKVQYFQGYQPMIQSTQGVPSMGAQFDVINQGHDQGNIFPSNKTANQTLLQQFPANNALLQQLPANNVMMHQSSHNNVMVQPSTANNAMLHPSPANNSIVHPTLGNNAMTQSTFGTTAIFQQPMSNKIMLHTALENNDAIHPSPASNAMLQLTTAGNTEKRSSPRNDAMVEASPASYNFSGHANGVFTGPAHIHHSNGTNHGPSDHIDAMKGMHIHSGGVTTTINGMNNAIVHPLLRMPVTTTENNSIAQNARDVHPKPSVSFKDGTSGGERQPTIPENVNSSKGQTMHSHEDHHFGPRGIPTVPSKTDSEDNIPDLLSGFDKHVASMKETSTEVDCDISHKESAASKCPENYHLFAGSIAHESPYVTSRSFDELHKFLGKGISHFDLNEASEATQPSKFPDDCSSGPTKNFHSNGATVHATAEVGMLQNSSTAKTPTPSTNTVLPPCGEFSFQAVPAPPQLPRGFHAIQQPPVVQSYNHANPAMVPLTMLRGPGCQALPTSQVSNPHAYQYEFESNTSPSQSNSSTDESSKRPRSEMQSPHQIGDFLSQFQGQSAGQRRQSIPDAVFAHTVSASEHSSDAGFDSEPLSSNE